MALDAIVRGVSSGTGAEVNTSNEVKVALSQTDTNAGFVLLAGLEDDGTFTGTRQVLPAVVSEYGRLAAGVDSLVFNDSFGVTAQNTNNYRAPATTQTVAFASGYAVLNNSLITTINTNSALQTYRTMPVFGEFDTLLQLTALHTVAPQPNAVTEFGLFTATMPGGAAPTDGAFFRFTAAGELRGVISYNGAETLSGALTVPSANVNHDYDILVGEGSVRFYADDVFLAEIGTPAGTGQPFQQAAVPFTVRHYIAGSAPASAMQFKVSNFTVVLKDMNQVKLWPHVQAGMGLSGYQGINGGTMGTSALYSNSLAPGAGAAATNTTAALGSGLGGQFSVQPTLAANTDGIISSFQNPAGGLNQTPRTLYVTGVRVQGLVTTALTGGPVLYMYSLAWGHTAVSLATAEAATTKAPRRVPLGIETYVVTAPVGTLGQGFSVKLDSPAVVYPGEFLQVVAKNVGTVTSAGVICLIVGFDVYWE